MKLSEIANPQYNKIKQWLDEMGIKNYSIRPDGIVRSATNPEGLVVDVNGNVDLYRRSITSIPVQFGNVTGYFHCADTKITSLQGAPSSVGGDFYCFNTRIKSLEGAPSVVGGYFNCYRTKITSLSGIHKIIKQINGEFYRNSNVTHILGLLLIPGITLINIDDGGPIDTIMNSHLKDQDIVAAQDELIDAGFKEQAKL